MEQLLQGASFSCRVVTFCDLRADPFCLHSVVTSLKVSNNTHKCAILVALKFIERSLTALIKGTGWLFSCRVYALLTGAAGTNVYKIVMQTRLLQYS